MRTHDLKNLGEDVRVNVLAEGKILLKVPIEFPDMGKKIV